METTKAIIEIKNLSKVYTLKNKELRALDEVSFALNRGESLGIVGESGSGKSTLAKIITQIEKGTSGKFFFDNEDVFAANKKRKAEIRRQIQMVFQNPASAISPRMNIGDFLMEALLNYKLMTPSEAKKEALRLLEMVELPATYVNKFSNQLSGGEMQRVVIARAISVKPQVVVFDEATSALDVLVRKNILKLLVKLKAELDISYMFIGHSLAVVRLVTERMVVMNQGKIVEILPSDCFHQVAKEEYTLKLIQSILTTEDDKKEV